MRTTHSPKGKTYDMLSRRCSSFAGEIKHKNHADRNDNLFGNSTGLFSQAIPKCPEIENQKKDIASKKPKTFFISKCGNVNVKCRVHL